jgi:hypothetical protein
MFITVAVVMSTPIRRIRSGCCARAASGHDAAVPPGASGSCEQAVEMRHRGQ